MSWLILRSRIVPLVGVTLLTGVAAALAGEVAVRYRERHRREPPSTLSMLYYRHQRLGYALVPNARYFGWIHINRYGFRGPEVGLRRPAGTVRIMVVGGSTTFDTQVTRDSAAWPARLQHWLGALAPERPVEVINAGVPGYRVVDNLIRLQTQLYRFRPDWILLYHSHNDISCALRDRVRRPGAGRAARPGEAATQSPWGRWFQRHSLLYNKVVIRLRWLAVRRASDDVVEDPAGDLDDEARPVCGPAQFERDVTLFVSAARTLGMRVGLVEAVQISGAGTLVERDSDIRAQWRRVRPYADPDSALDLYAEYNAVLRHVATSEGTPFLSTAGFGPSGKDWYADPMHFNDRGADRMARGVAEQMVRGELIGSARLCVAPDRQGPVDRPCRRASAGSSPGDSVDLAPGPGQAISTTDDATG